MRQIRTFLAAIGAVLAVCVGALAVVSTAGAAATATVAGTVTVPTGSPAGAFVSVLDERGYRLRGGLVDGSGAYRITGVPAGRVTLRFEPDPFRHRGLLTGYYGGTTRAADAEIVDLVPGEERTGLDHAFQAGRSISGTVRERGTGAPVQVSVIATPRRQGDPVLGTVAKPDGSYRLTRAVDGDYVIGFSYRQIAGPIGPIAGYYKDADTVGAADVVTVAGGDRTGIDTSVPAPPLSISGRVLDVNGDPIEGVGVAAQGTASGYSSATTGADGRYRIAGMPAGSYTVEFAGSDPRFRTQYSGGAATQAGATRVTVADGVHRTDVDARLQEQPHVRGTVTDAATGDPVPWARAFLLASDGRLVAAAEADEDGRYVVGTKSWQGPDVPASAVGGPHKVVFTGPGGVLPPESGADPTYIAGGLVPWAQVEDYLPQYYDGADRLASATLVDLPEDGGVAGIDGALERGGSITGSVERSASGSPGTYAYVTAYAADGQPVGETQADEDGNYALRSLAPGDYRVRFASASARGATSDPAGTRYYRSATTRAGAEPVTVVSGQATAIDTVDLEPPPSISGRVLVTGTSAPPVVPLTSAYLYRWQGNVATVVRTSPVSTVDGSYRLVGTTAGRYSVCFGGAGYASQCVDGTPGGAADVSGATRFDLGLGEERADTDAELRGDAQITGEVTFAGDGTRVAWATVVARHAETGDELQTAETGYDGVYRMTGLTPGVPVVLEFRAPRNLNAVDGFYGGETFATATRVTPGASEQRFDHALPQGAAVEGTVDIHGAGVTPHGIVAHLSDGTSSWSTYVEDDGAYAFRGLRAGRYELRFDESDQTLLPRPADEIVLATGQHLSVPAIGLVFGATVAGKVTAAEGWSPNLGTWVDLADVTVELTEAGATTPTATARTDASGAYRMGPVPAGNYRIRFDPSTAAGGFAEQYFVRAARVEQATVLEIEPRHRWRTIDATLVAALQAPTVAGRPLAGRPLTASEATWSRPASARSYRWFTCPSADAAPSACEQVATGLSFVPGEGHVGDYVELQETATVVASPQSVSAAARSNRVGPVTSPVTPTIETPPTLTGTPAVGERLDGAPGSWAHDPDTFRYAWYRCAPSDSCVTIAGADAATYTLTAADVGYGIELGVVASNADGDGAESRTGRSAVVPPANADVPTIAGTVREGARLTGTAASWVGNDITVVRRWLQCDALGNACAEIDGESGSDYVLRADDVGRTVRVREVAEKNGVSSAPVVSAATAVVTALEPTNTRAPSVDGTARIGATLTASDGSWAPAAGPFTYEWRWLRCVGADCAVISGAVGATYALTAEDVGTGIAVEVRATRLGRSTEWVRSSSVGPVLPPAPTVAGVPTISGTTVRDQTLAVTDGTWNHTPTAHAYRWLRCSSITACTEISDATGNRYRLSAADVGQRIAAEVRASNAGGASAWVRTALSGIVTAPPDPPGEDPPGDDPPGDDPPGDNPPGDRPPGDNPPGGDHRPGGDEPPGGTTPTKITATRVSALRLDGRGTRLQVRFRGGSKVRTTVTVSSQKALSIGGKRRVVRLASVTMASPRTTNVRLSALARQALRGRRSLPVTVRIAPRGGKAVTQRLTLRVR